MALHRGAVGGDYGLRVTSSLRSIGRPCANPFKLVTRCQALGVSGSSPSIRFSARNLRHPRRSTDSPRQERKPDEVLKTCTHRRVNDHLLVLLDPKRQRLIYVLGAASVASLEKQLPAVLEASEVGTLLFLDEATRKRLAVPQGRLTVCDVNPDGSTHESYDPAFRNIIGTSFEDWNVLVPSPATEHGAAASKGPLSPGHSRLRPLLLSGRRRNMTFRQWQRFHLGNRQAKRVTLRWKSLLKEYNRMAHAFSLGPDLLAVMNSDLFTMAMNMPDRPFEDPTWTMLVQLGDGPRDWTLKITLKQGGRRGKRGHRGMRSQLKKIERLLQDESAYLSNMQRLEEQWNSGSTSNGSQLLVDWQQAQSMLSTTGLAKGNNLTAPAPEAAGTNAQALGASGAEAGVEALLPQPQRKVGGASADRSTSDLAAAADHSAASSEAEDAELARALQRSEERKAIMLQMAAAARAQQAAVAAAQEEPPSVALTSQSPDDEPAPPRRVESNLPSYLPRSMPYSAFPFTAASPSSPPAPAESTSAASSEQPPVSEEDFSSSSSSNRSAVPSSGRLGAIGRGVLAISQMLSGAGAPKDSIIKISLPLSMRPPASSEDEGEEQQQEPTDLTAFCEMVSSTPKGSQIAIFVPESSSHDLRQSIHAALEAALASAGSSRRISVLGADGDGTAGAHRRRGRAGRRLKLPDRVLAMGAKRKGSRSAQSSTAPSATAEDAQAAAQSHPTIVNSVAQLRASAAVGNDLLLVAEPWALAPLAAAWHVSELRVMHPGLVTPQVL